MKIDIEEMRARIKAAYPGHGRRFALKVDAYTDEQVFAVYQNLKSQDKVK